MYRRSLLLALLAPALVADPRQEIYDLLGKMASGLAEENPEQFLEPFDRSMPGFEKFADNVRALVQQAEVISIIEPVDDSGDAEHHTMRFDWLLKLGDKENKASVMRREMTVELKLVKQKRKWRIVSLEPLDFFTPPRIVRP